jgi:hypothetical protein
MSNDLSWRLLPADAPGIPKLLVSASFAADSYSVHVTDLANIWVETMERRPIIGRGMAEDTSIDPSDGPDQIRKMLGLLRASFDTSDPEHHNTSLTLEKGSDGDSLVLRITCLLPKPLKPLKWPMHLKKCRQSAVATQLVLPLIQAHDARVRQINHLIGLLREKDHVIARVIDKLEATGTGLEHIFNALSGKRKVTRALAEEKIKGLAPFAEAEFRKNDAELRSVTQSADVSALLEAAFGAPGLQYTSELDLDASAILDDWWTKLDKRKPVVLSHRSETREAEIPDSRQDIKTKNDDDDDDDFQTQDTPPGVPSARGRRAQLEADDDETSDGEDVDEAPTTPASARKQGALSRAPDSSIGKEHRHARPSTPPRAGAVRKAASQRDTATDTHSETASDVDSDEIQASPPSARRQPPKRRGLGRIGGRPKREPTPKASTPSPPPGSEDKPSPLPRRHKLGIIGKKQTTPPSETPSADQTEDDRGRNKRVVSETKEQPVRETSLERADRKRAELQRDLEKRAAAGPAKKKRKF